MSSQHPTTLKIEAEPWETAKQRALDDARKFDEGEPSTGARITCVEASDVQRLLTPKQLELLETLMSRDVDSIRELSDVLDRNPSEVHADVHTLEDYGVVELRDESQAKKPVVPYDEVEINVNLSRNTAEP